MARIDAFDAPRTPIREIHAAVSTGRLSFRDLTAACLANVSRRNLLVHAAIEVNERALRDAERADELLASRGPAALVEFPLLGIPVLVKDNVVCRGLEDGDGIGNDGPALNWTAAAGSLALVGGRWRRCAPIVERLANAGAVFIASANMSGGSTDLANFWNAAKQVSSL